MDSIVSIIEIVKTIGPKIVQCFKYQIKFSDFVSKYEEMKRKLQSRQEDIKSTLETQLHPGKTEKKEVKDWLDKVDRIIANNVEGLASKEGCVFHICRAKHIDDKTQELKEIFDDGEKYTKADEYLVMGDPSRKGVAVLAPELQGRDAIKAEILKYLMGDKFTSIGVCGIGGVGKTTIMKHVHNHLLKNHKFKKIIFVTVSNSFNVTKLQKDIASQLRVPLVEDENETIRAATLSEILRKGSYVLILDDVWESFALEEVGIPNCVGSTGCKLVLTTRFRDVARRMSCKVVDVELLPENEALQLFLDKVGNTILSNDGGIKRDLESILKQIVAECSGLPLAIVTVASSMKEIASPHLWEDALHELRELKRSLTGESIMGGTRNVNAFEILKFSYDRLIDKRIQNSFLYCALYPEDYVIPKDDLIECWIQEGFFDEMETRHEMTCKGYAILRKLEDNCLLECVETLYSLIGETEDEDGVKMHDVLRSLALDITSKSSPFFVRAGMNMRELPNKEEWAKDLKKISLMWNFINEIPSDLSSPRFQMLTTLLLSHNNLSSIPESFFEHMNALQILDLSHNYEMESLPKSIFNLENLTTLLLKCCKSITLMPSLSKCSSLTKLDLNNTGIEEVPQGIEMLLHLKYLDLSHTKIRKLPDGIIPQLSCLQSLSLRITGLEVKAEELAALRRLEYFDGVLRDWDELRIYVEMMQSRGNWLRDYKLQVGGMAQNISYFVKGLIRITSLPTSSKTSLLVPHNVKTINIEKCHDFRCINQLSFLNDASHLTTCSIFECESIEFAFSLCFNFKPLQTLHLLILSELENLKSLFEEEDIPSTSLSFPLKTIWIFGCPKIKKLFLPRFLLRYFSNLETIIVEESEQLEEIIASESEEEEEEAAAIKLPLPRLKNFILIHLPKLKRICGMTSVLVCDSLETLGIGDCPMLERVPLYLPQHDNSQLSLPSSLKEIEVSPKEWWESLEWDHPNAKEVLSPFVRFVEDWMIASRLWFRPKDV